MRVLKLMLNFLIVFSSLQMGAQEAMNNSGTLNASTDSTFSYEKNGVSYPFYVSVREKRTYAPSFKVKESGIENMKSKPAYVAKLITIKNPQNDFDNRVISLKYKQQVTDSFELVSTSKGFAVVVDDRTMEYILGEGIYFANTADQDFFIVDEFDTMSY